MVRYIFARFVLPVDCIVAVNKLLLSLPTISPRATTTKGMIILAFLFGEPLILTRKTTLRASICCENEVKLTTNHFVIASFTTSYQVSFSQRIFRLHSRRSSAHFKGISAASTAWRGRDSRSKVLAPCCISDRIVSILVLWFLMLRFSSIAAVKSLLKVSVRGVSFCKQKPLNIQEFCLASYRLYCN